MTITNGIKAQELDFSKVKAYEHQLDDVMEIIDTSELKLKRKHPTNPYRIIWS